VVHLISDGGFEDREHLGGDAASEPMSAERAEGHAKKPENCAKQQEGPIHGVIIRHRRGTSAFADRLIRDLAIGTQCNIAADLRRSVVTILAPSAG